MPLAHPSVSGVGIAILQSLHRKNRQPTLAASPLGHRPAQLHPRHPLLRGEASDSLGLPVPEDQHRLVAMPRPGGRGETVP